MMHRKLIKGYAALQEILGGRSRASVWRDIRAGRLPAPIELGPNSRGWWEDEIQEELAKRARVSYAPSPESAEESAVA